MKVTKTVTGTEPVTLAEAKEYLRVFHDTEDNVITQMITNARKVLEMSTGLSLVEQTIEIRTVIRDSFTLPYGPISSVTFATIDDVYIDDDYIDEETGIIKGTGVLDAMYEAGPYECKIAMLELVSFYYWNRGGGQLPETVKMWIANNTRNLWLQ